MRLRIAAVVLALLPCVLPSCAGAHHKIVLKDGRSFVSANEPRYVEKTGYYRYKALNGKDALVQRDEVLQIIEL